MGHGEDGIVQENKQTGNVVNVVNVASNLSPTAARLGLAALCELGKGMSWARLFPVAVGRAQGGRKLKTPATGKCGSATERNLGRKVLEALLIKSRSLSMRPFNHLCFLLS